MFKPVTQHPMIQNVCKFHYIPFPALGWMGDLSRPFALLALGWAPAALDDAEEKAHR